MRIFDDNLNDLKWLPPIRFKGGSKTTTTRNIPDQTGTEAGLQNNAVKYANNTMGTANGFLGNLTSLLGDFDKNYGDYTNTANNVNNGYTSLVNGELPSTYATARQNALNSDLTSTVGNMVNNLVGRGVMNSSARDSNLNSITRNSADSLNRSFSTDMGNYANILNNTANNNSNNLNNFTGLLSSQLGNANSAYNNTGDLFKTMYSGRMGSGGTTTTQSGGKGGLGGALGSVVGMGLGNSSFGSKW